MTPLVFILMSRKSEACYTHALDYVHKNLFDMSCKLSMSDFELAMRKALRTVITNIPTKGCWFHYCQALCRKAKTIKGFLKFIAKNIKAREVYKQFYHLPLLPVDQIENGFKILQEQAALTKNQLFMEFVSYFKSQWMVKVSFPFIHV